MKELGYGKDYAYDHDAPDAFSGQNYFPDKMPAASSTSRRNGALSGKSTSGWRTGTSCAASGRKRIPAAPERGEAGKASRSGGTGALMRHPPAIRPLPQSLPRRQPNADIPSSGVLRTRCGQPVPSFVQNGFDVLPGVAVLLTCTTGAALPVSGGLRLHPGPGGIQTPCPAATTAPCHPRTASMRKRRPRRTPSSRPGHWMKRNRASMPPDWLFPGSGLAVPRQLGVPFLCGETLVGACRPFPRSLPAAYAGAFRKRFGGCPPSIPGKMP